jgi:pantoate--beta-alanine ligase
MAKAAFTGGERRAEAIRQKMLAHIASVGGVEVEYIAVMRDGTVEVVHEIEGPVVVAIAARVGSTRLIDNIRIS